MLNDTVRQQLKQLLCKWRSMIDVYLVGGIFFFSSVMCVWLAPSHIYDYVHTKFKCMLKMVVDESEKVNIDLRKVRYLRMVYLN